VLNVGIFSIQMTEGPDGTFLGGRSNAKSGSKILMSRTSPFQAVNNGGSTGMQRPRSGSTIHFNQKRAMTPGQENHVSYDNAV
jgi:hypothetical protein